jgi:hypothetical protein
MAATRAVVPDTMTEGAALLQQEDPAMPGEEGGSCRGDIPTVVKGSEGVDGAYRCPSGLIMKKNEKNENNL